MNRYHYEHKPKVRDDSIIIIERRLTAWAGWAKENRKSLGYPTISSLFRVMMDSRRKLLVNMNAEQLTARGKATQSFREESNLYVPEPVSEIETIVAHLPRPLQRVLIANYFTYGPIEVRAKAAGHKRARFSQLLEAAKYCVWMGIVSRTDLESTTHAATDQSSLSAA